jgi:hypothetical protein
VIFSGPPVSSTNKTDHHAEIFLKIPKGQYRNRISKKNRKQNGQKNGTKEQTTIYKTYI